MLELKASYEGMARRRPDRYQMLMNDLTEATRQGTAACAHDTLLERTSWDFKLEVVPCTSIFSCALLDTALLAVLSSILAS